MHRKRTPPVHTAAICIHMPPSLREVVENYATECHISLGEAGRSLIEAGAKVLAAEDGRSWRWDGTPSDVSELEDLAASRIELDFDRREGQ